MLIYLNINLVLEIVWFIKYRFIFFDSSSSVCTASIPTVFTFVVIPINGVGRWVWANEPRFLFRGDFELVCVSAKKGNVSPEIGVVDIVIKIFLLFGVCEAQFFI